MCGRYTLSDPNRLMEDLDARKAFEVEIPPRYNVAPSQPVVVISDPRTRSLDFMQWGLVPSWAKDISIGSRLINARAETITEKASFRTAFRRRRCLILADGFYEWSRAGKAQGKSAAPYFFQLTGGAPFAFAGLWEIWQSPEGDVLKTCTIITTQANSLVGQVHERMSVILTADTAWAWLEDRPANQLLKMLQPFPAEQMQMHAVSSLVNNSRLEDPALVRPLD